MFPIPVTEVYNIWEYLLYSSTALTLGSHQWELHMHSVPKSEHNWKCLGHLTLGRGCHYTIQCYIWSIQGTLEAHLSIHQESQNGGGECLGMRLQNHMWTKLCTRTADLRCAGDLSKYMYCPKWTWHLELMHSMISFLSTQVFYYHSSFSDLWSRRKKKMFNICEY